MRDSYCRASCRKIYFLHDHGDLLNLLIVDNLRHKGPLPSRHPIGKHHQLFVALIRVVVGDVYPEIMLSIHTLMHHEAHRKRGLLAGL
jgi:hypothetical protein